MAPPNVRLHVAYGHWMCGAIASHAGGGKVVTNGRRRSREGRRRQHNSPMTREGTETLRATPRDVGTRYGMPAPWPARTRMPRTTTHGRGEDATVRCRELHAAAALPLGPLDQNRLWHSSCLLTVPRQSGRLATLRSPQGCPEIAQSPTEHEHLGHR